MAKTPMLVYSPLTDRVFVLTKYKTLAGGYIEAFEKYDVTDQFEKVAQERETRIEGGDGE